MLSRTPFEKGLGASQVTGDEVLALLDYPKFFELAGQTLPANKAGILERLTQERMVLRQDGDRYDITNLGALLFAKKLSDFETLARKAVRVIKYKGSNRVATEREKVGTKGYAAGSEELIGYINDHLPQNEVIGAALRREVRMYPEPRDPRIGAKCHDSPGFFVDRHGSNGRGLRRPAGNQQSRSPLD